MKSNKDILSGIGDRVRRNRLNKGASQEDISKASGVGLKTVQRIEKGENYQFESLIAVCRALGLEDQFDALFPVAINPFKVGSVDQKERKNVYRPRGSDQEKDENRPVKWGED